MTKCENSSSLIEESIDDPVQLPQIVTALSPVLKWLRSLGLAKYEDVFIREEIDWDTLQSLTEEVIEYHSFMEQKLYHNQFLLLHVHVYIAYLFHRETAFRIDKVITLQDLLGIGITSLGPRKKIVNALSGLREAFASSAEAHAQSHCTSGPVTERRRDKSTTRWASEPKIPTANKLITEFFPGQATEGMKIRKAPKEPVAEKSPSDSSSRRAVRRNGNNGKSKVIPHWNCIPGTPFRVVILHNKPGHGFTSSSKL